MNRELTEEVIYEIYTEAMAQEYNIKKNNCDNISSTIGYIIETEFDIPAYTVKAPVNNKKHFVCVVPGEFIHNYPNTEFIIIDGSIEQFSDSYPELNIESISNSTYYDNVSIPEYTLAEATDQAQTTLD